MSLIALVAVREAAGQPTISDPGSFEITAGVGWESGYSMGARTASLTTTDPSTRPAFTLFRLDAARAASLLADARLAWRFAGPWAVEARVAYARPTLRGAISGDPEAAVQRLGGERLSHYGVDGSLVWHFGRPVIRRRTRTYVLGGAGYLRELHTGRTLAESGRSFHAAGGVKVAITAAPDRLVKGVALRVEGRATVRTGGGDFDDRLRAVGSATGSLMLLF